MKRLFAAAILVAFSALPALAQAEKTWTNVPVVDTMCYSKVKDDPDSHPRSCAMKCSGSGYGIVADGEYLKLDKTGNEKLIAALKESKKTDHLRVTVTGERDGDTVKVSAITLSE